MDASRRHLLGRMAIIEARVKGAVARRRSTDAHPEDGFRGLYVSEDDVDALLEGRRLLHAPDDEELVADVAASAPSETTIAALRVAFGLDDIDIDLLLVALAPDLDPRFERLYGYLHDDVTRRRASVGLALELVHLDPIDAMARARLLDGPLLTGGLVEVEDRDRPFLTRSIRVPDRVGAHLLGDSRPAGELARLLVPVRPGGVDGTGLARAIDAGAQLLYLREPLPRWARALAADALHRAGYDPVAVDLSRLGPDDDVRSVAAAAAREARLHGGALIAGPIDAVAGRPGAVTALADAPCLVVLSGALPWDPHVTARVALAVDIGTTEIGTQERWWRESVGSALSEGDVRSIASSFRLGPDQTSAAVEVARWTAAHADADLTLESLRTGARAQNASGLERLARRVRPRVSLNDLVVTPEVRELLHELIARARFRRVVAEEWGMRSSSGNGITALFAGPPGTGKTMAAEVVAGALGLDLYTIDLATVVDKYIGETEKNLDRIFAEADGVNGVLLFDEADALFGKRSDVRDARDRYANIEVAYLLQRMEAFEGIAVLATNLRANLDEAFARRLDVVVDFPLPDERLRRKLWERSLPASVARHADLDLDFCASAFELSGGNITNIGLAAAYYSAEGERPVTMRDAMRATAREYRKLGRLCTRAEFGDHLEALTPEVIHER